MKIIIVGLGSMGKRRLRLLKNIDDSIEIVGVDSNKVRTEEVEQEFGVHCKNSITEALSDGIVDCAFVCTSPLSHRVIISELLENNLNVFTEINLVSDGYKELTKLAQEKNKVLFLSSTFLYRKDIQAIATRISGNRVNYIYHTGQYLPDWHPWESFKDFFVSDIRTNGCREIMAIEFPWLINCFGKIKSIQTLTNGSLSTLEISYCDNYLMMVEHENGNKGLLAIDVVSRKARRSLEVFGENIQIFWDGTPDSLKLLDIKNKSIDHIETYQLIDKDTRYTDNIIENAYEDEIIAFLYQVNTRKKDKTLYDFEKDICTLQWIDKVECGDNI